MSQSIRPGRFGENKPRCVLFSLNRAPEALEDATSQYSDETGAWWTEFPGSDQATWSTPPPSPGLSVLAPAQDGVRGAVSKRALKHGLVVTPGKRERARREAVAQRRRQVIAAIREPSLKSGVITVGSGFGGTGKTDVAVTLAAIYAAVRPADRVILADSNDDMPHGYIRLGGVAVEALAPYQRPLSLRGFYQACSEGRIKVYADLRDAVAWLQGVAVIRGDTADECVGVDFGEQVSCLSRPEPGQIIDLRWLGWRET